MKKIKLRYPLLVEGLYDKNRVCAVAEGCIIYCGGFALFSSEETRALLRRITQSGKLLVLTDSDGAGMLIRNKLKGFLKSENVINLYTPTVKGVEKRKRLPSKAGILGVEGMSDEVLYRLLSPYGESNGEEREAFVPITASLLYSLGLTGAEGSAALRGVVCRNSSLPENLSPKAFREALNLLGGAGYLNELLKGIENFK